MTDYVLGIDPGAKGALALYNCQQALIENVWDMPFYTTTLTTGKKKNRVNIPHLFNIMNKVVSGINAETDTIHIHIELVSAWKDQSAAAAFSFGYESSVPHTIARVLGIEPVMVPPASWKRKFGLQATVKDASRQLVLQLFPYLSNKLKHKKDVDKADAVLIACY